MDWVAKNHIKPAVVNMSLGGGASTSLDNAVNNLISKGVVVVVSGGNSNQSACNYSPARVPNAITVGATTSTDYRASYSNYGDCLDLFAPGSSIKSAWNTSNTATASLSGTSMASPHVVGVVALFLQQNPYASVADTTGAVVSAATSNKVKDPGTSSPNLMLFSLFISKGDSEIFSKTISSKASYDGWVLESSRTSSKGGSLNKTASTLRVGDDSKNHQYRSILHFDTKLPAGAQITSVQLKVRRYGIQGTNPFKTHGSLNVDMRKGSYSGSSILQIKDWQASSTKTAAAKIANVSVNKWYTVDLPVEYINTGGVTQLRLRFSKQDNGDKGSDYISFYSGNTDSNKPQLIIEYYIP